MTDKETRIEMIIAQLAFHEAEQSIERLTAENIRLTAALDKTIDELSAEIAASPPRWIVKFLRGEAHSKGADKSLSPLLLAAAYELEKLAAALAEAQAKVPVLRWEGDRTLVSYLFLGNIRLGYIRKRNGWHWDLDTMHSQGFCSTEAEARTACEAAARAAIFGTAQKGTSR